MTSHRICCRCTRNPGIIPIMISSPDGQSVIHTCDRCRKEIHNAIIEMIDFKMRKEHKIDYYTLD